MEITGIICEYNPFHLGHQQQFAAVRRLHGQEERIVCLMSGNYVQRGAPAILDKSLRAKAAVLSGADLVLELPVTASLSSAEGFASEGVRILSGFCDHLCFGAETLDRDTLIPITQALLSPAFSDSLRKHLDVGISFPAARQRALEDLGLSGEALIRPNDILAVEYCKAILSQGTSMQPLPIHRPGSYHDTAADPSAPSATALRGLMLGSGAWLDYVPTEARSCFENAPIHTLEYGERAVLSRLRCMTEREFEALPYGSEGLWRKFMHAVREQAAAEEILTAVKSKRYTRTRLDRMLMCAYLGITQEMLSTSAPYVRVLAFNDRGREILKKARQCGSFINTGEPTGTDYEAFEYRCGDLYALFAAAPEPPGAESSRRVVYVK